MRFVMLIIRTIFVGDVFNAVSLESEQSKHVDGLRRPRQSYTHFKNNDKD